MDTGTRRRTCRQARPRHLVVGGAVLALASGVLAVPGGPGVVPAAAGSLAPAATTWSPVEIDASPGLDEVCGRSGLASGADRTLYAVTTDYGRKATVRFVRSTDSGRTWSAGTRLSGTTRDSGGPALASAGALVHAVWVRGIPTNYHSSVMVRTNTARGAPTAWRPTIRLTSATGRVASASIAAAGSSVYVAVTRMGLRSGTGDGAVLLFTSRNSGRTWSQRVLGYVGSSKNRQMTSRPVVEATGKDVVITWVRTSTAPATPTSYAVTVRTSRDRAVHLTAARVIGHSRRVQVDAQKGGVTVAAYGSSATWTRTWRAGSWDPRRPLPWADGALRLVPVRRGSHEIGIASSTYPDPPGTEVPVLRWARSTDDGRTWSAPERVSSEDEPVVDLCAVRWRTAGTVHVMYLDHPTPPEVFSLSVLLRSGG